MSNLLTVNNIDFNNLDLITRQKMLFIYNSLENGWSISKQDDNYIFKKKHNNNSEVLSEQFLKNFIKNNFVNNCD